MLVTRVRRFKSCCIHRICGANSPSKHADFFDGNGNNVVGTRDLRQFPKCWHRSVAQVHLRSPLTSDLVAALVPRGTSPTTSI